MEFYRFYANYLITSFIAYYFILDKSWYLSEAFSWKCFTLGIVFLIGLFGWLPYFVKNITECIRVIFEKVLRG
jgi:hypothetical protein